MKEAIFTKNTPLEYLLFITITNNTINVISIINTIIYIMNCTTNCVVFIYLSTCSVITIKRCVAMGSQVM